MKDGNGQEIKIGDIVRICGIPDLSGMRSRAQKESLLVFQYLVGKRKRIKGIDKIGNANFMFRLKQGNETMTHWVGIEPHLLRKPKTRKV